MNSTDHLIEILETEPNPDHWYDYDLVRVGPEIDRLAESEWARLVADLPARSEGFRRRLAQTQLYSEQPRATELLVELLRAREVSVGAMAAEMLLEKNFSWSPELPLRAEVQRHLAQAAQEHRAALERLLRRLIT